MNALLNYPGAKWGMAQRIISLMPTHRSYLEPFFGSGAVLFRTAMKAEGRTRNGGDSSASGADQ